MNFNAELNSTFAKDTEGFIAKTNNNWPELNK